MSRSAQIEIHFAIMEVAQAPGSYAFILLLLWNSHKKPPVSL